MTVSCLAEKLVGKSVEKKGQYSVVLLVNALVEMSVAYLADSSVGN
jgi:hypothetical protein